VEYLSLAPIQPSLNQHFSDVAISQGIGHYPEKTLPGWIVKKQKRSGEKIANPCGNILVF
jgi:hypothetical protein